MQYDIVHSTRYGYGAPVLLSRHVARLTPRLLPTQACLHHRLDVSPEPTVRREHCDYFGNAMTFFMLEGTHRELEVTARSRVRVDPPAPPEPEASVAWEAARDHARLPCEVLEYVFESPAVRFTEEIARYARPSFPAGRPFLEAVLDLTNRIHGEFQFDTRATTVATPLAEVLRLRRGVCQDFSHLAVGCLRMMGLAARYVSGYLF